jgi:hypothetical protein
MRKSIILISALTLSAAFASAQGPYAFYIQPSATTVGTSTAFTINLYVKSLASGPTNLAAVNVLFDYNPTYVTLNALSPFTGMNGFQPGIGSSAPGAPSGYTGDQIEFYSGSSVLNLSNQSIPTTGVQIAAFNFTSTSTRGTSNFDLPTVLGNFSAAIIYLDGNGNIQAPLNLPTGTTFTGGTITVTNQSVPEPISMSLLALGAASLLRRKK